MLKCYHESETHVEQFGFLMVISENRNEIRPDDSDLSETSPERVVVIVPTEESDQVFDAFQAVVVLVVLRAVVRAQGGARGLQFDLPLHQKVERIIQILKTVSKITFLNFHSSRKGKIKIPRTTK